MSRLYVAVVVNKVLVGKCCNRDFVSGRQSGDWAAFVGEDRKRTVGKALEHSKEWGSKYTVLVGELTTEAVESVRFEEVSLNRGDEPGPR